MFSSSGLFQSLSCPERNNCNRPSCIFSHSLDLPSHHSLNIPVQHLPQTTSADVAPRTVPSKRPFHNIAQGPSSGSNGALNGPPIQRLRVGIAQKPVAVPAQSHTSTGVPIIRINPAQSQVALPVRQAMLKTLYDHFVVLYDAILPLNPTIASEHALRQEEQVYSKSTKLTYRNVRLIRCQFAYLKLSSRLS